jgi:hypothetical protein
MSVVFGLSFPLFPQLPRFTDYTLDRSVDSLRKLDAAGSAGLFCRLVADPSQWGCQVPEFGGPQFTDAAVSVQRTVREAAALAAGESPLHRLLMKRSQVITCAGGGGFLYI